MTQKEFILNIQRETESIDFERYFRQLNLKKLSKDENIAIFEVANRYIASWIKNKYENILKEFFEKYSNFKPDIDIRVTGEKN